MAQLERENKDRERAFEELREGLNQQRTELETKDDKIKQLERKLQQFGRQGDHADVIGDMQEVQHQQRLGSSKSYNDTRYVPLRSNLPLATLDYEEQRAGTNNQTNSDELFNFSQSQLVHDDGRGAVPADQLYRSGYDQDNEMAFHRQQPRFDERHQDVGQDLKERSLPEEFDDEDDDCLSRDEAGENPKANLRLKNSQVNRLLNMPMQGYAPASHAKHQGQVPLQLEESRIPASGSMLALQDGAGMKAPLQQRQMNEQHRVYS